MDIAQLALALGAPLAAGLNLYITVLTLGLLHRFEWMALPGEMQVLAHSWVLGTAALLLLIEFVADKVPYVDSTWDFVHGFIRVPAGAVLAVASLGQVDPELVWVAALVGGFVSFTAHSAKASTRLLVNSSPEPFSNWMLSFLEDGLVLGLLYLVVAHPVAAIGTIVILLGVFLVTIVMLYRFFKRIFRPRHAA